MNQYEAEGRNPKGYNTMSEDATKEQHEAEELSHVVQTFSVEQQTGLLCYLFSFMSTKPEWPILKEAVEFYIRGSGLPTEVL